MTNLYQRILNFYERRRLGKEFDRQNPFLTEDWGHAKYTEMRNKYISAEFAKKRAAENPDRA